METINGIDDNLLSSEQNTEGKINIMIERKGRNYRTGFIYDSIKVMHRYGLRVSQKEDDGTSKYGLISVCGLYRIVLPCIFDKIKPYKGTVLQAFIGDDDYYIDRWGQVYDNTFMQIRDL